MNSLSQNSHRTLQPPTWVADRLQTPLWVFDIQHLNIVWANAAGVSLWGALLLADALRKRIKEMSFPLVGHQTISLGVAEVSPNELPCQALMRADMALFKAKANGRDRVEAAA